MNQGTTVSKLGDAKDFVQSSCFDHCPHPTSSPPSTLSTAARRIFLKCKLGFITLLLKTLQGWPLLPTKSQSPGNVHKAQHEHVPLILGSYLLLFFLLLCSRYTDFLAVPQAWQTCSATELLLYFFPVLRMFFCQISTYLPHSSPPSSFCLSLFSPRSALTIL